jgi:hypothetical protein
VRRRGSGTAVCLAGRTMTREKGEGRREKGEGRREKRACGFAVGGACEGAGE